MRDMKFHTIEDFTLFFFQIQKNRERVLDYARPSFLSSR